MLFGGSASGSDAIFLDDTWEWDQHAWSERHPQHRPPARQSHALSALERQVVLFGGLEGSHDLADTWQWDGTDWTEQTPPTSPPPRRLHTMAALGSKVVLFGGVFGEPAVARLLDDTWEWDGRTWTEKTVALKPPGGVATAMMSVGQRVLMISEAQSQFLLWAWDGKRWQALESRGAPAFRFGALATTAGNDVVLFGGSSDGRYSQACPKHFCTDTWRWTAGTWLRQATDVSDDLGRGGAAMTAVGSRLLLFGGWRENGVLGDTWTAILR